MVEKTGETNLKDDVELASTTSNLKPSREPVRDMTTVPRRVGVKTQRMALGVKIKDGTGCERIMQEI
jgi:hypothetical protein